MSITHLHMNTATADVDQERERLLEAKVAVDATHAVTAYLRRVFHTAGSGARRAHPHREPHYDYLEFARMSREMERL